MLLKKTDKKQNRMSVTHVPSRVFPIDQVAGTANALHCTALHTKLYYSHARTYPRDTRCTVIRVVLDLVVVVPVSG